MTFVCSQYDFHPYECGGLEENCPHCRVEEEERAGDRAIDVELARRERVEMERDEESDV